MSGNLILSLEDMRIKRIRKTQAGTRLTTAGTTGSFLPRAAQVGNRWGDCCRGMERRMFTLFMLSKAKPATAVFLGLSGDVVVRVSLAL